MILIDTQETMTTTQLVLITSIPLAMCGAFVVFTIWMIRGKEIRCWWRRRKLTIPKEENGVRTISGPTWNVKWIKVSEMKEKRPDEVSTTVLGRDLPEVIAVLKARYGDEFEEINIRSADKHSYSEVLVGLPEVK